VIRAPFSFKLAGVITVIYLLSKTETITISRNTKILLRNQDWALILEPVDIGAEEWKRIGIARIVDELVGVWETRVFNLI
jgi:hypothetical protein